MRKTTGSTEAWDKLEISTFRHKATQFVREHPTRQQQQKTSSSAMYALNTVSAPHLSGQPGCTPALSGSTPPIAQPCFLFLGLTASKAIVTMFILCHKQICS